MLNIHNHDYNTNFNTLQEARRDLVGEIEAIIQYDNHINSITNPIARETWISIRDEEMVHVGELIALINYLNPNEKELMEKGINEFNQRLKNI